MNAIGWQIGAVLFGLGILIIAIYLAKTLNSTNKTIEKVNRVIDCNEAHINRVVANVVDITDDVKSILDLVEKITGFFKILRVFKK